ncbi:membrane protein insertion efficiency factor YidD [Streptomyces sp. A012304]|uniref:membrane protein insertion efficiency factor YidD n=1 Tax=Streptomyces sp. A012304 TaxID=375446 RepID=UPI00222E7181|nr:membrane protein insertion efficiency factor YidD [Streptomyces sp. A012304]GKQ40522.1 hypothetical protein ALMP_70460 [Streptomyces sp. A012304]
MRERRSERQRRRQARRERGQESCVDGALDSCLMCRQCCPEMWLASLALAFLAPRAGVAAEPGDDHAAPRPAGRVAGAMYEAVRRYRVTVSPGRPACCPYTPSCSTYAVKALARHGALRGGRLIVGRLLRCRPEAARRRGFRDPVPS